MASRPPWLDGALIGAVVAALAGAGGVWYATRATVQEMHKAISVQTLVKFAEDFDAKEMEQTRAAAAQELLAGGKTHGNVDDVLDFFELFGLLVRNGSVDLEAGWQTFSYLVEGYTRASKSVIADERASRPTVWENLDWLRQRFDELDRQHDRGEPLMDVHRFLADEADLAPSGADADRPSSP